MFVPAKRVLFYWAWAGAMALMAVAITVAINNSTCFIVKSFGNLIS